MKKFFNFLNKYKLKIITIFCAASALTCFTCAWFALSTHALSTFVSLLTAAFASTVITGSFAYLDFGWNKSIKNSQTSNNCFILENKTPKNVIKNLTASQLEGLNNIDKKSSHNYRVLKKSESTEETTLNSEEDLTI